MVYVPTDLAIKTVLSDDLDANLLGTFNSMDANVEPLRIHKTIYLPVPFIRKFLSQ